MAQFLSDVQQTNQFKQMSESFPDEHPYTLERFLIARDLDVEAATLMLQNHIEWRKETLPVQKESIMNEAKKGICFLRGKTKQGYPVIYARTRFQDKTNRDLDEALNGAVYVLEKAVEAMGEKKQTEQGKLVLVMDRTDSTRANLDIELWKRIAHTAQDHYPERLHKVLIVPTTVLFRAVWKVFKWFLDPKTRAKVQVFANAEDLLEYIDASELVADLGGTNRSDFNIDDL
mmetsp:Transcript_29333/g.38577  ORF Transcript_29333/g.38577 Transcript_29333/m.38577 type:complete len:231 (-) Transcript_29333:99-791(-)|eukprot:CAMPEP_0117736678 /NCGR_PEP_ID=MMETSP0947-20121206/2076_1 /TAXON_ID=44440 /ORGANISM="Chattonella subsalsa, Strain CCMP2191" /LENGTH=230 /DNA_ID=CAMNT_0005552021 /DNA_START=107 /DNA_END=799 /DNA_ORIENTATION=+